MSDNERLAIAENFIKVNSFCNSDDGGTIRMSSAFFDKETLRRVINEIYIRNTLDRVTDTDRFLVQLIGRKMQVLSVSFNEVYNED